MDIFLEKMNLSNKYKKSLNKIKKMYIININKYIKKE